MPTIFQPIKGQDPLGASLAKLGAKMFGNQTANAINNEKLYALERANTETDNLGRRIAADGGAQALSSDPIAQAMIVGSGYAPKKFGDLALLGAASQYGAADPRTQNLQVGTGESYDNTAGAFNSKLAETARNNNMQSADRRYSTDTSNGEKVYEFNNKPMAALDASGSPVFVPQNKATDFTPVLSDTQQKGRLLGNNFDNLQNLNPEQQQAVGARVPTTSATPRNYILNGKTFLTADGKTDLQSGQPLPAGGYIGNVQGSANDTGVSTALRSNLDGNLIANRKFNTLANIGLELTKDPTLFGAQGYARSLGQEIATGISGAARAFGKGMVGDQFLQQARKNLADQGAAGLIPELYDPNLPKVDTIWGLLVYQGAQALAGQSGRGISDQDVKNMRMILGDPKSLFSSPQMMQSKLETARKIVNSFDNIDREALGGKAPIAQDTGVDTGNGLEAPQPMTPAAAPQAPQAPTAAPNAQAGQLIDQAREAIAKGADRNKVIERLKSMGVNPGGL